MRTAHNKTVGIGAFINLSEANEQSGAVSGEINRKHFGDVKKG